ncbi:MAG: DUF5335 domain-containing protein [Noviherbaspirillum sp.]
MTITKLEKAAWHTYFDSVSKALVGKRAEIEVDALPIAAQLEAEWLPFYGITYDPKDDMIEVVLEGVDHLIRKPREVFVDLDPVGMLNSVEVLDGDGVQQIVRLRDPLMLPSPSHG